jgi:hypothetical protein
MRRLVASRFRSLNVDELWAVSLYRGILFTTNVAKKDAHALQKDL